MDLQLLNKVRSLIEDKAGNTFLLFDRGEFYCSYANDAVFLAKEIFQSESVLRRTNTGDNCSLSYVNINKNRYLRIVRDLLFKFQFRIELYSCEDGAWILRAKGSPGNLGEFEDMLGESNEMPVNSSVISVKIGSSTNEVKNVAFACCDTQSYTLTVGEFVDGPHFSNLEATLVHLDPKECVLPSENTLNDYETIDKLLKRSNVFVVKQKKQDFNCEHIIQDLNRLLRLKNISSCSHLSELNLENSNCCSAALIKYLGLLNDDTNHGRFHITQFHLNQYMRLDSNAVRALELFSTSYTQSSKGTLQSLLNKCRSLPGQKLLEERLDVVDALIEDSDVRSNLYENLLCKVPDLLLLAKKLVRKKSTLQECYRLYQVINIIPLLIEMLEKLRIQEKFTSSIQDLLYDPILLLKDSFVNFVNLIQTTLDLEYLNQCGEFRVKPDFDPNLLTLSEKIDKIIHQIDQHSHSVAQKLKLEVGKGLKLDRNVQSGYAFRVTRRDEKMLRGNKYFTVLDAKTAGVRFTDCELQSLNDRYMQLKERYETTQEQVISHIMEIAVGYVEPLRRLTCILSMLDVLVAFAEAAETAPIAYMRPNLMEKGTGELHLSACRHPCLEIQDDVSFIPNDIHFSKDDSTLCLVTGPNMGGKSTYLRQTAITVLMAQMGCFVPCSDAKISIVDAIFTRVGACDYQSKGISTFMAEMLESASILEAATSDSLVIVDELGRGTSTYDGFGIAWAIAEYIAKKIGCFCLFATHFHELTALADDIRKVRNVHMAAVTSDKQLTLMYEVKPGVSDQSFGIHVAELVKFPKEVVEDAWKKLAQLENSTKSEEQNDNLSELKMKLSRLKQIAQENPSDLRFNVQSFMNVLSK